MAFDHIFLLALQSSLLLGLIHGVNPCGHSWLVLAPFVYGERNGKRVFTLTSAFIIGTSLACLAIGLSLGAISMGLPENIRSVTDIVTSGVLVVLGLILLIRPELLHHHDHDHEHGHSHGHDHHEHHAHADHDHHAHGEGCCGTHAHGLAPHMPHATEGCCGKHDHHHDHHEHVHHEGHDEHDEHEGHDHHAGCGCTHGPKLRRATFWGLFIFGFMNMIVPCPTLAIMYTYAIDSSSIFKATAVFASYAVGTAIALAGVIFAIYKVANAMRTLNQPWLEPLIMRVAGLMTIAFGVYNYLADTGYL